MNLKLSSVVYRNVGITVLLAAVYFLHPLRVSSQSNSSGGPCHSQQSTCNQTATDNYNSCVAYCNGDSDCISTCQTNLTDAKNLCSSQFNQCIQNETDQCEQMSTTCPGMGNSGGYCSFAFSNEQCICVPCQCPSSPPPCPNPYCESGGYWQCDSPILIDGYGEGFHLTSADEGVYFDLWGDGQGRKFACTDPKYRNAWLALDRNGDGLIDNGTELFGSATEQPTPPPGRTPNGFNALAMFDSPENGGNGNGFIDPGDAIYGKLLLWIDENHDGISQPSELKHLADLDIRRIDLQYQQSHFVDQFGNAFFYKARIWDSADRGGRFAWDVFLKTVE